MSIDSFRPSMLRVVIDATGLGGVAPADGFIDPTTVYKYRQLQAQVGTVIAPTVSDGDTITIGGTSITFTTSVGLTLAGIILAINELTDVHHVIASNNGANKLKLTNEISYETFGMTVAGPVSVLTALGFVTPVVSYPYSQVASLVLSEAKARANERWNLLTKLLGSEVSPSHVGGIEAPGATIDAEATEISFTVTYQDFNAIYTYDELNNNALLKGIPAVKRWVARALITNRNIVIPVFDPTHVTVGTTYFERGERVESLVVAALAADLATAEANITVDSIALVR